ncbi:MAG: methylmalonyl-CoA mutase family protein [Ignavibacteria bacterium]
MNEEQKNEIKLAEKLNLKEEFEAPSFEIWKNKVIEDLKGADYDKKLITKTYEGIQLKPIYTKDEIKYLPCGDELPGSANYLRGTKASGNTKNSWYICQEIPYADAEKFNAALLNDLKRGQTAIQIKFDTATELGLDADYAQPEQVGDKGLSVSALNSIGRALNNVDLKQHPIFIDCGFSSLPFVMIFNAYLKQNNIQFTELKGSIESDPLGYLAESGKLPVKINFAFDKLKLVTEWASHNASEFKTIGIKGLPYHNAGASAVQELAFALGTGLEYLNQLKERGLNAETIAAHTRFTFGVGTNYFMEVAKFRAARVLWSKILETFDVDENLRKINIHARTSKFNQTVYDPYVNMLRTTTQAFSAIIGGADSLHTNAFDELFGSPTDFSRRIARNTQIILSEESHLNNLIDPAGGSYYIEKLTNDIAEQTWTLIKDIESKGGMLDCLKSDMSTGKAGYIHELIEDTNQKRRKDVSKRKASIVGTNNYANLKEEKLKTNFINQEAFREKRSDYLQKYRLNGNQEKHSAIIEKLNELVTKDDIEIINLGTEAILEGATLGEISHAARAASEDSISINPVKPFRIAELFEELRNASGNYKEKTGVRPKVFLATMGPVRQHKARADFSRGYFESGGFEVVYPDGFKTNEEAVEAAVESKAQVIVICSTDDTYPEIVPGVVKGIKAKNHESILVLAGYPKDQIEQHKESGIDEFIFLGSDVHATLQNILKKIGVL